MNKEMLDKWLDDEFTVLDNELNNHLITEVQYNEYTKNLMAEYNQSLNELLIYNRNAIY